MLKLTIPGLEVFNEKTQEFEELEPIELKLEHSLAAVARWESKWEEPFLGAKDKSQEQTLYYIECMFLGDDFPPGVFSRLTPDHFNTIENYINSGQSATWFREDPATPRNREPITSELIYYWMVAHNINWQAQNWPLNRLLTLIRVCNVKQEKPKKVSKADIARQNRELNAQRRAQMGSKG